MTQDEAVEKAQEAGIPAQIARHYGYELHSLAMAANSTPKSIVKLVEEVEYLTQQSSGLSATQAMIFKNLKKLAKQVRGEIESRQ